MPTDNLPENIDATYPDNPTQPDVAIHQQHHDRLNRVHNRAQIVIRWNNATKTWEESRPSWAPWGVVFDGGNDAAASLPSVSGLLPGDRLDLHPSSTLLSGYAGTRLVWSGSQWIGPAVTITTTAPVPNFTASPLSGAYPLTVQFQDLTTGSPTSRTWNFGDGTPTSSVENPTHTYTKAGSVAVSLTAANGGGARTETKDDYITVTAPPVNPPTTNLIWRLLADDSTAATNTRVTTFTPRVGTGTAAAPTDAARPLLLHNSINGHKVIRFIGTGETLALTGGALALAQNRGNLVISQIYRMASAPPTAGARTGFALGTNAGTGRAVVQLRNADGWPQALGRRADGEQTASAVIGSGTPTTANEVTVLTAIFRWETSELLLYKNGVLIASRTDFTTDGLTSNTASSLGAIGSNLAGTGEFAAFDLAEVLVYNTADLSLTTNTQITDYAVAAYGVVTNPDPDGIPANTVAMPTTSTKTGWTYSFGHDFNINSPLGNRLSEYGSGWSTLDGARITTAPYRHGSYRPAKSLSVENSMLHIRTFYEPSSGEFICANPYVQPPAGHPGGQALRTDGTTYPAQEYPNMRASVRYFVKGSGAGWKVAWLLWSATYRWEDGEIDMLEGGLDGESGAFFHPAPCYADQGAPVAGLPYCGNNQLASDYNVPMAGAWHTATVEWINKTATRTGSVEFFHDGISYGRSTTNVPSKPMHWQLQTEPWLSSTPVPQSSAWDIYIDWLTVEKYTG